MTKDLSEPVATMSKNHPTDVPAKLKRGTPSPRNRSPSPYSPGPVLKKRREWAAFAESASSGRWTAAWRGITGALTPSLSHRRFAPAGEGGIAPRVSKVGRWRFMENPRFANRAWGP